MIIVLLTVVVAAVLRVPVTDWHLAVLVPLEVTFVAISWFAVVRYLGRMADGERAKVGWATMLFAPEFILLCLPMLIKGEGPELVWVVWEKWNEWLGSLSHTTYVRAACATVTALVGFCLTVAAFAVEKEITLAQVPLPLLLFVAVMMMLSIVTTIRGGELGKWFSRWLLLVGFIILSKGQARDSELSVLMMPFSVTFFALYFGRFIADVGWKRVEIASLRSQ